MDENNLQWMEDDGGRGMNHYITKTYGWMSLGLLATFGISYAFYLTGAWMLLYSMPFLPFVLMIVELGVVMYLTARLQDLPIGMARVLFFTYALLNGLTFSSFFAYYGSASMIYAFAITAVYFGALTAYGFFTKRDLSGLAPIFSVGLIIMLVFWLLSAFLPFDGMTTIMCFVGLALFMGLTAYDTQKLKHYYTAFQTQPDMLERASIYGALQLYLDFVNLFLYILRILSRKRN